MCLVMSQYWQNWFTYKISKDRIEKEILQVINGVELWPSILGPHSVSLAIYNMYNISLTIGCFSDNVPQSPN